MRPVDFPLKGEFISSSPPETIQLGEKIGIHLKPGSIVALRGKIGAGKTVFAKGIAHALGITEEITSPTYTIISEYQGNSLNLHHMDAYRLSGEDDFRLTGGEELLYDDSGVCVIEWPERISLPETALYVDIEIMEDGKRHICYGLGNQ